MSRYHKHHVDANAALREAILFGLFAVTHVQSEGEDEEPGVAGWLVAAAVIYGGVIHNQCHRLCVFLPGDRRTGGEEEGKGAGGARWRSCKLMERQVRAATLDNFAAPRFIAVVKKKEKPRQGRGKGGTPRSGGHFFFV